VQVFCSAKVQCADTQHKLILNEEILTLHLGAAWLSAYLSEILYDFFLVPPIGSIVLIYKKAITAMNNFQLFLKKKSMKLC
jgi:hypothetical protein